MIPRPGSDYYASDADMAEYYGTDEDWAAKLEGVKLCDRCGQPPSFHRLGECPHLNAAGSVERWGPERWQHSSKGGENDK